MKKGKHKKLKMRYNIQSPIGYLCGCKSKNLYNMIPVEVDDNGICLDCGYHAFYNNITKDQGEQDLEYKIGVKYE